MNFKINQVVELKRAINRHDIQLDAGQVGRVLRVFRVKQAGGLVKGTQHALVDFAGVKATVRLTSLSLRKDLNAP